MHKTIMTGLILFAISLLAPSVCPAAPGGKVFDPSGMPVAGAWVKVYGDHFETAVTDSKGRFNIEVPRLGPESYG